MRCYLHAILVAASLVLSGGLAVAQAVSPAPAAGGAEGPAWHALSAQQRAALAPLQRDWAGLNGARKAKWLEVAARFPAMPPAEQQRVQVRMTEWARLTPAERGQARLSFQESKQLSGEQKQQRWDAYQALSDEQREALAKRAKPEATSPRGAAAAPGRAPGASSPGAPAAKLKPVGPTMMQAKPGATTSPMTQSAAPPAHQQPGQPAVAARPGEIDRRTLLPRSGPQAAASAPQRP